MRKFLRFLLVTTALVLGWLATVHFGWLPPPTPEQRAALERLHAAPPPLGKANAFAAIWFSGHDVPDAELEALMAEEAAAWDRFRTTQPIGTAYVTIAQERYAEIARPPDEPGCGLWQPNCLGTVRANREAVRGMLADHAAFARKAAALEQYDHVADPITGTLDSPLAQFKGLMQVGLVGAALKAADGDARGALTATCSYARTWRTLRGNTDMLIADMIGVAALSASAQLAADIIADAPRDLEWPAECAAAFAPLDAGERDQCEEWKSEYAIVRNSIEDPRADLASPGGPGDAAEQLFAFNRRHLVTALAPYYDGMCTPAIDPASGRAIRNPTSRCSVLEHVFDPGGCALLPEIAPNYAAYIDRLNDLDGRLATLRTAIWLRDQPGDAAAAFASRPADLRTVHSVAIDATTRTLTMTAIEDTEVAGRKTWTARYAATPRSAR